MKIGILREEKNPSDERVAFTPKQCKWILENTILTLVVQKSDIRCFSDEEYRNEGIELVDSVDDCDVLIGIKEIPKCSLLENKKYFYFSHTIKEQPYNRDLLKKMLDLNIEMVDYEALKGSNNKRLLGFGRYAGIVGAYNGLLTYGLKSGKYNLKAAYKCIDREEVDREIEKISLTNEKIILTGKGRVANGALEVLSSAKIKEVSKEDFIINTYDESVFCRLDTMDYNVRIDGSDSEKYDFYNNPEKYKSSFMKYAKHANLFIAGHFYSVGSPFLFTREDANSSDFNIRVVADISCDIDGPVASTIRSSTIKNPIYGYNPITEKEDNFTTDGVVAVMAVDNLPCELPKDASEGFGELFLDHVIPAFFNDDQDAILSRAKMTSDCVLTSRYSYLQNYIEGKE